MQLILTPAQKTVAVFVALCALGALIASIVAAADAGTVVYKQLPIPVATPKTSPSSEVAPVITNPFVEHDNVGDNDITTYSCATGLISADIGFGQVYTSGKSKVAMSQTFDWENDQNTVTIKATLGADVTLRGIILHTAAGNEDSSYEGQMNDGTIPAHWIPNQKDTQTFETNQFVPWQGLADSITGATLCFSMN